MNRKEQILKQIIFDYLFFIAQSFALNSLFLVYII
jgi:hypothetical protein